MSLTAYSYFSSNLTSEEELPFNDSMLGKELTPSQIAEFEYFKTNDLEEETSVNSSTSEVFVKENYSPKKLLVEKYYEAGNAHSFRSVAKWEGVVEYFDNKEFSATLKDLKNGGTDEKVVLSIDEVSIDDRKLIKEGAIFYWHIGYEQINGTIKKSSILKFKRTPKWSKKQIDIALDKVNELKDIKWE